MENLGTKKIVFIRANLHDCTPAIPRAMEACEGFFNTIVILCFDRTKLGKSRRENIDRGKILRFKFQAPPRSISIIIGTMVYQAWLIWHLLLIRPDAIHVCDLESAIPASIVGQLVRAQVVYDMRDPFAICYEFPGPIRVLAYFLDWLVMGLSSAFVIPCEYMLEYLGRWRSSRPVVVIKNTCHDHPDIRGIAKARPLRESKAIKIAFFGYLVESRGAHFLLNLCESERSRVEVLVAGQCRSESLWRKLGSSSRVSMYGLLPREQALAIMSQVTAVSLLYDPSIPVNKIAAPNKFFESMMCGTPVLVSEGMELGKIVKDEGLGIEVKYNDMHSLTNAVRILDDKELVTSMRRRCREYFLANCQLKNQLVEYRRFYGRILIP